MRRTIYGLPLADELLAAGLLAVRLVTLFTGAQPGGGAVTYLTAPFLTLPMAWRTRAPLAVAWIVSAANITEVSLGGQHDSVVFLAVFLLVPYSLASRGLTAGRMAAGLGALAVSGGVSQAAQPMPGSAAEWASTIAGDAALILIPFLVGLALRQQRLRAEALEELAARLRSERDERERTAVAEERARIARELHDEVAHAMSVIAVQADAAEGALSQDPSLVSAPLVAIRRTAREALSDMRRVVGALRGEDALLAPEPGLSRLEELLDQARGGGITVTVLVDGATRPLPPPIDIAAYRVIQEGLTNVRKHAGATHVDLHIHYGPEQLTLEVVDDGDGSAAGTGSGRGLVGIRERVTLLDGDFTAHRSAEGFCLRVDLPLT